MPHTFSPTLEEASLAEEIIQRSSGSSQDYLDSDSAVQVFSNSGLSTAILADVWNEADEGRKGHLTRDEVALALRLIGWAQSGSKITPELVTKTGPLAHIQGFDPEPLRQHVHLPSNASTSSNIVYPPLSLDRHSRYKLIFVKAGAPNDDSTLDRQQIWKIWQKSGLPEATLSNIWNLVNTQHHDYLDSDEFCLGMHFIQGLLAKHFSVLPVVIPPHLARPLQSLKVDTISSPSRSSNDASMPSSLNSPFTTASFPTKLQADSWEVPQPFITYSMRLFAKLDISQRGYLDEATAVSLLKKSKLSNDELASIWKLADISGTGRLSRDEFVIALFLVSRKLSGVAIPASLPLSFPTTFSFPEYTYDSPDSPSVPNFSPIRKTVLEVNNLQRSNSHVVKKNYAQIRALQDTIEAMGRENDDLRSSVETLSRISRQQSLHNNRISRNMDTSMTEIAQLQEQLQAKDAIVTRLQASLKVTEDLSRENTMFRLQVQELISQLEVTNADLAVQTLLAEENSCTSDALRHQVEELRESSTNVPSVSGDEELQMLINEDLSRENRRLRSQIHDLEEYLAQLQAASEELELQKETTRALTRENKRLLRRIRELESAAVGTQTELRRQVEDLSQQNEQLRRELQSSRTRQTSTDLPPPAYEDIHQ